MSEQMQEHRLAEAVSQAKRAYEDKYPKMDESVQTNASKFVTRLHDSWSEAVRHGSSHFDLETMIAPITL